MEAKENARQNLTLAVIGCGNLGTAILAGLIASQKDTRKQHVAIAHFVVCIQTATQEARIAQTLPKRADGSSYPVQFLIANNVEGASRADVIVLACPPYQAAAVLGADGMRKALAGKLLISMMGGVLLAEIERALYSGSTTKDRSPKTCHILRAITNMAAAVGTSVTIVGERSTSMPLETLALGKDLLGRIGNVVEVEADQMPAATALSASGTAFFALLLEAAADGAVALGIRHDQAAEVAAQTMAGAANLALSGHHPALIRAQVTTPGGSTARGLAVLEEGAVRGKMIQALRETASVHSK